MAVMNEVNTCLTVLRYPVFSVVQVGNFHLRDCTDKQAKSMTILGYGQ